MDSVNTAELPQSLVEAASNRERDISQLMLFSSISIPRTDYSKPPAVCTSERLAERDPERLEAAIALLADPGVSIRQVASTLNLSINLVRAIAARAKISIDTQRAVIVDNMRYGLRLATEQVIEKLPEGNLKDSTIAVGVLNQNLQLIAGGATQRVELSGVVNVHAQFRQLHEETMKRLEAIEIGSQTGLGGENGLQKALTNGSDDSIASAAPLTKEA